MRAITIFIRWALAESSLKSLAENMSVIESLQYRGDKEDIRSLVEDYQVEDYLDTHLANRAEADNSVRDSLLSNGVQLNESITPRAFEIAQSVFDALGLDVKYDLFCVRDLNINAFALLDGEDKLIGITSAALELLNDGELKYIIGHEIGHFLYGHNDLMGLINSAPNNPRLTVLPFMGERLFLRWRKKSELSADRIGFLACGDFNSCGSALIKTGFGLSERNLNLDLDSLMNQLTEVEHSRELVSAAFRSHPLLPLRLKSLSLFSEAYKGGWEDNSNRCEDNIDSLFEIFKRHPQKEIDIAVMKLIATAGILLIGVENDILDEEIRSLVTILQEFFTDNPEDEIIPDKKDREEVLSGALKVLNAHGNQNHKTFVISRLADIAIADGKLLQEETGIILEIASQMDISPKVAYGILIGSAQANGFKVDVQLNNMVSRIKRAVVEM